MGRIMIELPGVKEPERVRKLLQGSANLEFWETYAAQDVLPALIAVNTKLAEAAKVAADVETGDNADATADAKSNEADLKALKCYFTWEN